MAVGFTADIWVNVAIVVSAIGVGLMGKVGFMGKGCTIIVTLNLLFMGALALFCFSAVLGTGIFHSKEFLSGE